MDDEAPRIDVETLERVAVPDPERPGEEREVLRLGLRSAGFHIGARGPVVHVGHIETLGSEYSPDTTLLWTYLYSEPPEGARIVVEQMGHTMEAPEGFTLRWLDESPGDS